MKDNISNRFILNRSYFLLKVFLFLILNLLSLIQCGKKYDNDIIANNDLFLILAKDGYLRAFETKEINEKWNIFFGDDLIPKNINSHKFTNDIILYPINDKLYISLENDLIPFDIFVKNLISIKPIINDNISVEGHIDNYIYLIDLINGKIVKKINSNKSNDILINNNEIMVKKVNYFLFKKEKDKNENLMNISYSEINIELKIRNNHFEENNNMNMNLMHYIMDYFKINLEIGKIISIHSYNYKKEKLSLIYDKNIFDNKYNNDKLLNRNNYYYNNKNEINKDENSIQNKLDDLILRITSLRFSYIILYSILIILIIILMKFVPNLFIINFNNTNIINENYHYNFPEDLNSNKNTTSTDNFNNEFVNYNKNVTITDIIEREAVKDDKNEEVNKTNKKEICCKINNFSIISNNEIDKANTISLNKKKDDINIINNDSKRFLLCPKSRSSCELIPNCLRKNKEFSELIKNFDLEKNEDFEENDSFLDNENNLNPKIKNKFPDFYDFYGKYHKYCNFLNKKINITECRKYDDHNCLISLNLEKENTINCLVPLNELTKFLTKFKLMPTLKKNLLQLPDNNLINKENSKTIKESKEEYNSTNSIDEDIKNSVKKYAGIWDDDEDDNDDNDENDIKENESKKEGKNTYKKDILEEIDESASESENISKISDKREINKLKDNSYSDKNKNINYKKNRNEIMNKSRLDKDFKNLEKIGQGGFGIVLKGEHRLDKGVCAIKIIKLKDINDRDSIINEAITMTKLTSKHIVQYKTCWIDNNLGSASKLFYEDNDFDPESISLNVSRSEVFHKKITNTIIDDESEDNDDESDDLNVSKDEERDNAKFSHNIKNKNDNSQELEKTKNRSKYCCNYRDDSHIGTTSIISNRYINESKVESEKLFKGEYFFILMEYCDGLTLDKYILQYGGKSIDRKIIYNFMSQILKSLVKIHSSGIIHRDIKPCNIFIKNDQIKIGDFGLATRYSNTGKLLKSKKIEGTPLYLSPEQKNFKTYNEKVDIYACGITLYEMVSCFSTSMERFDEIMKLKNHNIINERIIKNYPEESALIKLMTKSDYNERPSAKDILESELFIKLGKSLGC